MHCLLKGWYTPRSGAASFGFRVYIAKITFTALIDHFTSLHAVKHLVYSYQLIKLELLTESIRQQKLPPHRYAGIYLASDKLLIPIQLRRLILTGVISVVNLFIHTIRTKIDGLFCL
jgi:hypothetical protein